MADEAIPTIDLKYARDLLRRINSLEVEGKPLSSRLYGDYNIWHCYQMLLLFVDIKEFSRYKKLIESPKQYSVTKKILILPLRIIISVLFFLWATYGICFFLLSKKKVLVQSVDRVSSKKERCDFRLEKLYTFLHDHHVPYIEIFHTHSAANALKNAFKRRRPALYLEMIDRLFSIICWGKHADFYTIEVFKDVSFNEFTPEEIPFVKKTVLHYLNQESRLRFQLRFLTWILRHSNISLFVTIDDTRYYHMPILAARRNGVPSVAIQHGHFTKYHVGLLTSDQFTGKVVCPDTLVVWSEYWERELLRLGPCLSPEKIMVGGDMRQKQHNNLKSIARKAMDKKFHVLVPYEIDGYKNEISQHLKKLSACPQFKIHFKLRQDIDREKQIREYKLHEFKRDTVHLVTFMEEVRGSIDVVLGSYSTFLYHMIEDEIPIGLLETNSDFGEGLLYNELAEFVPLAADVCEAVYAIAHTPRKVLNERRRILIGRESVQVEDTLTTLMEKHDICLR